MIALCETNIDRESDMYIQLYQSVDSQQNSIPCNIPMISASNIRLLLNRFLFLQLFLFLSLFFYSSLLRLITLWVQTDLNYRAHTTQLSTWYQGYPPMSNPVDLTEALGVTPFFHLIPKNDLAPLLSFSGVDPSPIRLASYLPDASLKLADAAASELNKESLSHEEAVSYFVNKFREFDDPDLQDVKFKKPVILGHSDRTPESPTLGPLYKATFKAQELVGEQELTEPAADVGDIPVETEVQILQSWDDPDTVQQHILRYSSLLDQKRGFSSSKRPLTPPSIVTRIPHKRIRMDTTKLGNHRESALYAAVEELEARNTLEWDQLSRPFLAEWVHKLSRIIGGLAHSLRDVDTDYLQMIQLACISLIKLNLALSFLSSTSLELLSASDTILAILNSSVEDRRLHVGTYIDAVIDSIDLLVKSMLNANINNLEGGFVKIGHCIDSLANYLSNTAVDELVITKLEYISVAAVFSDSLAEGSDVVRNALINLMVQIFRSYDNQRQFLVNEMLLNFKRLPHQKASTRQLRLKTGVSVLFFTVFLLRLVQSFSGLAVSKEVKAFLKLTKSNNRHSATNFKRTTLVKNFLGIYADSVKIANQIAEFFFQDITSADAHYKIIFGILIDDLLSLLTHPDWPGALTMLESMMKTFMSEFKSNKLSGLSEPFILEIMGKIGHEIFLQKHHLKSTFVYDANNLESLRSIIKYQRVILTDLRELCQQGQLEQEYNYMLLRFLRLSEVLQSKIATTEKESHIFALAPENNLDQSLLEVDIAINEQIDYLMLTLTKSVSVDIQDADNNSPVSRVYMILALGESLEEISEQYFSILISSLESSKAKVATKAIKLLSPLIDIDTRILLTLKVNQSISRLLTGNSSLSRDAVIDLLGKYISESSELTHKYCKTICERAADTSILVRRRVIKLMRDMYHQCLDVDIRGYIAVKFLRHTEDVDKLVSEAAKSHLAELWFTNNTEFDNTCDVMAWTVNSGSAAKNLLQQYFTIVGAALNKQMKLQLKRISDAMLEKIVEEIDTDQQPRVIQRLNFLSVLVGWDRRLLNYDQFLLLLPYILDDREPGDDVCYVILRILKFMLVNNRAIGKESLVKLRDDLLKKLTKLDVRELHEAIPVIQSLSDLLADNNSIANALISSMRMLKGMFSESMSDQNGKMFRCCKLLHLLGCIGAYCDLESARAAIQKSNVGLLSNETIVSLILKYLLHFTKPLFPEAVTVVAIRNVIEVATHHPKIFLSDTVLNLLDQVFGSLSSTTKLTVVEGLNQFLSMEDDRNARNVGEITSSKTVELDKNNFHGTLPQSMREGVCASVIQRFLSPILEMCLKDSTESTLIPVHFLRLVIRLGYANPKVCISTVIALEASTNKAIKRIATELHSELFEKHESLTDRNYTESFKLATHLVKRSRGVEFLSQISFLRSVYKVINRNYLSKKRFVLSLAKLFALDMTLGLDESIQQRDSVIFLSMNLLVVNFSSLEEVCLCLYHLDRSITVDGIDLAEKIKGTVESKSGSGMSVENLQLMFLQAQSVLALIYLRQVLATAYGIGATIMDTFRPSKPDVELRQAPKSILVVDYPLDELDFKTGLGNPSAFGKIFTRLVFIMRNYTT